MRSSRASPRTPCTSGARSATRCAGTAEIRARTEEAIAAQEDIRFGHEPLAITPDGRGVARWWVSLQAPAENANVALEGIFLVKLNADGLCTDFREWFNVGSPVG